MTDTRRTFCVSLDHVPSNDRSRVVGEVGHILKDAHPDAGLRTDNDMGEFIVSVPPDGFTAAEAEVRRHVAQYTTERH
jgi:hypothetical protein